MVVLPRCFERRRYISRVARRDRAVCEQRASHRSRLGHGFPDLHSVTLTQHDLVAAHESWSPRRVEVAVDGRIGCGEAFLRDPSLEEREALGLLSRRLASGKSENSEAAGRDFFDGKRGVEWSGNLCGRRLRREHECHSSAVIGNEDRRRHGDRFLILVFPADVAKKSTESRVFPGIGIRHRCFHDGQLRIIAQLVVAILECDRVRRRLVAGAGCLAAPEGK